MVTPSIRSVNGAILTGCGSGTGDADGGLCRKLAATIYVHPTMAQATLEAALDVLGRAIHKV